MDVPALVALGVGKADAQVFRVYTCKGADVCPTLTGEDAHVLLKKVGQFLHELAARGRGQLAMPSRQTSGSPVYHL